MGIRWSLAQIDSSIQLVAFERSFADKVVY
ncbi:hypothetical protein SCE1572_36370 [Sorangium cellulosum So0157-2]|uniref:Uncharacterized protein n=1 Tax=Sorangium cellulosum So0157-2 TaxID=1254432 RepID=S4Y1Y8_SORCE|nr:hypothetical protein SCE1572_36370 [Sorangium cellulosum So0157-2]